MNDTHLVVLINGLNGGATDWAQLSRHAGKLGMRTQLLAVSSFSGMSTHWGIERGANKVMNEVLDYIKTATPAPTHLSIVGHSLGGLVARFVVKLLKDEGVLTQITPYAFVTMASPHLGVRRPQRNPWNVTFQNVGRVLCKSTKELTLYDRRRGVSDPLLVRMTEPDFLVALALFPRRVLYANVFNDFQVPYTTAALRYRNPYRYRRSAHPHHTKSDKEQEQQHRKEVIDGMNTIRLQQHSNSTGSAAKRKKAGVLTNLRRQFKRAESDPDIHTNNGNSTTTPEFSSANEDGGYQAYDNNSSDIDSQVLDEDELGGNHKADVGNINKNNNKHDVSVTKRQLRRAHGPADLKRSSIYPSITVWSLTHVHRRMSPQSGTLHPLKDGLAIALDVQSMQPARINSQAFRHDKRRERLKLMLARLDALGWERYDTAFSSLMAHEQIIGKRSWVSGADVVRHLLLHVLQPDAQMAEADVGGRGHGGETESLTDRHVVAQSLVSKM